MGVPTYQPIANVTLGSAAASVTFSGITQQYRDLVLIGFIMPGASAASYIYLCPNGVYNTTYGRIEMLGNGTSASSATSNGDYPYVGYNAVRSNTANMQFKADIFDYSVADKQKTFIYRLDTPTGSYPGAAAGAVRNVSTSPITSLLIQSGVDNFPTGTSFALYGVIA